MERRDNPKRFVEHTDLSDQAAFELVEEGRFNDSHSTRENRRQTGQVESFNGRAPG